MDEGAARDALVTVLDQIPGVPDGAVSLRRLCRAHGLQPGAAEPLGVLLDGLGLLNHVRGGPEGDEVKAVSESAYYFIRSLAEHLRRDAAVLTNWERPGVVDGPSPDDPLSGPGLLYAVERRRLAIFHDAPALRRCAVAQVIVKAARRGAAPRYLLVWDQAAGRYQLPGGLKRGGDTTMADVAVRELGSELPGLARAAAETDLRELGVVTTTQVSRTVGAATTYEITFYHLRLRQDRLPHLPGLHWVTAEELLNPDRPADVTALRVLDGRLPGGLASLPSSVPLPPGNPIIAAARANPWEFTGIVLAVLGIAISVFLFMIG